MNEEKQENKKIVVYDFIPLPGRILAKCDGPEWVDPIKLMKEQEDENAIPINPWQDPVFCHCNKECLLPRIEVLYGIHYEDKYAIGVYKCAFCGTLISKVLKNKKDDE